MGPNDILDILLKLQEEEQNEIVRRAQAFAAKVDDAKKEAKKEAKKANAELKNDCNMWILQLKAFILDTLLDEEKANSQTFINFLDELNKLSVIL